MSISPDDSERYRTLTRRLRQLLVHNAAVRGEQPVAPGDLAIYLEWFAIACGAAPAVKPFSDRSSPYTLRSVCYLDLRRDFGYLSGCLPQDWEEDD